MSKHIIETTLLQELISLVEDSCHATRTIGQVNKFLKNVAQSVVLFEDPTPKTNKKEKK